ncbi:MAG: DedA family protein [Ktedonobacterales bacterium]
MVNSTPAIFQWASQLPALGVYAFVFAWLFVESTGFPISDEPLLLLAGYLSIDGTIALLPVIVVALIGKVLASCVAYWIGSQVALSSLARPARLPAQSWQRPFFYIRPTRAATEAVEEQFRRRGVWGVFFGRLIPVIRSFISYPAGAAHMPFPVFLGATAAGSLLWITFWTVLGAVVGRSYLQATAWWGTWSWLVPVAVVLLLAGLWLWRRYRRKPRSASVQVEQEVL